MNTNLKKSNTFKVLACAAVLMALVPAARANLINGSIAFTGTYTANGSDLLTSTSLTIATLGVGSATGDLAGAGAPMSFATPIGVNGNINNPVLTSGGLLWSVSIAGVPTYTFTVSTETQTLGTTATQLNLTGTGVMHKIAGAPASDTPGEWNLGFGRTGAAFAWQSTSATPVPEPSTCIAGALLLLPFGASTIRMLRRKNA